MLTEKDYCDYETCVALRELGYNIPQRLLIDYFGVCDELQYDERIHLYDAQKWLREEKDIFIVVCPYTYNVADETYTWTYEIGFGDNFEFEIHNFKSYEEALSEGIKEVILNIQ